MHELLETTALFTSQAVEFLAIVIIVVGLIIATGSAIRVRMKTGDWFGSFEDIRNNIGRTLLLGLEFLLAGEIIRSVAVGETLEAVVVLGLIVLVRTFLSIAIEMEIHGRWPWQRHQILTPQTLKDPTP